MDWVSHSPILKAGGEITGLVFSAPYVNARQTDHGWGFPGNRPGSLSSLFLDLR